MNIYAGYYDSRADLMIHGSMKAYANKVRGRKNRTGNLPETYRKSAGKRVPVKFVTPRIT